MLKFTTLASVFDMSHKENYADRLRRRDLVAVVVVFVLLIAAVVVAVIILLTMVCQPTCPVSE